MEPRPASDTDRAPHAGARPRFVLVSHRTVLACFGPDEAEAAADTAYRMAERDGEHIELYETPGEQEPPMIGTEVDPHALGWVAID